MFSSLSQKNLLIVSSFGCNSTASCWMVGPNSTPSKQPASGMTLTRNFNIPFSSQQISPKVAIPMASKRGCVQRLTSLPSMEISQKTTLNGAGYLQTNSPFFISQSVNSCRGTNWRIVSSNIFWLLITWYIWGSGFSPIPSNTEQNNSLSRNLLDRDNNSIRESSNFENGIQESTVLESIFTRLSWRIRCFIWPRVIHLWEGKTGISSSTRMMMFRFRFL